MVKLLHFVTVVASFAASSWSLRPVIFRRQLAGLTALLVPNIAFGAAQERSVDQVVVDIDGVPLGKVKRLTGEKTGLKFAKKEVEIDRTEWAASPPWSPADFSRIDSTDDSLFYDSPKLVYHIDEGAVSALTDYYKGEVKGDVLDICSSWVSHYPEGVRATGVGINPVELANNVQLDSYKVVDLNKTPKLPFESNSFDVVTCVVSIDYLTRPVEVLKEVRRVLRPGGRVIVSQSNRLFFTKAIRMWLPMSDEDRLDLIAQYFHYAGFEDDGVKAYDITPTRTSPTSAPSKDPMFIVQYTSSA